MRKLIPVVFLLVCLSSLGYAQGDFNDNSPIQSGYAVVTAATTGSMVVFETFGLLSPTGTNQAGVLPPDMITNALLFVSSSGRLSRNLGIAIANPGSSTATITMTLRDNTGVTLGTKTIAVVSGHQTAQFLTQIFSGVSTVPSDLTGTVTITSNTPIAVIGLRFRGANFSTLPVTDLSTPTAVPIISTGVGGPGAVLLPQFAAGGGWASEINIINTGTSSLSVRVDLFNQDGSPLTARLNGQTGSSFSNLTILAGGVLTLTPRDANGDSRF
jgi:hypothetical protein